MEQIVPKAKDLLPMTGGFSTTSGMTCLSSSDLALDKDCVFKEKDGNTILWMIMLNPGEKKVIDFHYRVLFPSDINVEVVSASS